MAKLIGVTDAITSCDCCGKSNLKRTVCLELEGGEQVYYGVNCAAKQFRQHYMGKKQTISAGAILDAAKWASYYRRTNQPNNQMLNLVSA